MDEFFKGGNNSTQFLEPENSLFVHKMRENNKPVLQSSIHGGSLPAALMVLLTIGGWFFLTASISLLFCVRSWSCMLSIFRHRYNLMVYLSVLSLTLLGVVPKKAWGRITSNSITVWRYIWPGKNMFKACDSSVMQISIDDCWVHSYLRVFNQVFMTILMLPNSLYATRSSYIDLPTEATEAAQF